MQPIGGIARLRYASHMNTAAKPVAADSARLFDVTGMHWADELSAQDRRSWNDMLKACADSLDRAAAGAGNEDGEDALLSIGIFAGCPIDDEETESWRLRSGNPGPWQTTLTARDFAVEDGRSEEIYGRLRVWGWVPPRRRWELLADAETFSSAAEALRAQILGR